MKTDKDGYPTEPVLTRMSASKENASRGVANPIFSGPRAVLIRWPSEDLEPGDRVRVEDCPRWTGTLTGYVRRNNVEVKGNDGRLTFWPSHMLDKIPATQTVLLELTPGDRAVPLSVVERVLSNRPASQVTPQEWVQSLVRKIVAEIDGEEADDE